MERRGAWIDPMACTPTCAFVHLREGAIYQHHQQPCTPYPTAFFRVSQSLGNYSKGSKRLQVERCEGKSYLMNMDFVKVIWEQNHCDLNKQ